MDQEDQRQLNKCYEQKIYPDEFEKFYHSDLVQLHFAVPLDEVLLKDLLYLAFETGNESVKG